MSLGEPEDITRLEEIGMRAVGAILAAIVAWKVCWATATFLLDLFPA